MLMQSLTFIQRKTWEYQTIIHHIYHLDPTIISAIIHTLVCKAAFLWLIYRLHSQAKGTADFQKLYNWTITSHDSQLYISVLAVWWCTSLRSHYALLNQFKSQLHIIFPNFGYVTA